MADIISNQLISEASGAALDNATELVGIRRGYVREDDESLRKRALKRVAGLDGMDIRGRPLPEPVKKSRYDIARGPCEITDEMKNQFRDLIESMTDIPKEFAQAIDDNFWDLIENSSSQEPIFKFGSDIVMSVFQGSVCKMTLTHVPTGEWVTGEGFSRIKLQKELMANLVKKVILSILDSIDSELTMIGAVRVLCHTRKLRSLLEGTK